MRQSYGPLMLACAHHPELGSFAYLRGSALHVIDLASCRDRVVRRGVRGAFEFTSGGRIRIQKFSATVDTADGRFAASVRATGKGQECKADDLGDRPSNRRRASRVLRDGVLHEDRPG